MTLCDLIELFDLRNVFTNATCVMKNCQPALLDVIYDKKMFYNKYLKNKNSKTWDE